MLTVYGIPNCDKMKKVFKMLEASQILSITSIITKK